MNFRHSVGYLGAFLPYTDCIRRISKAVLISPWKHKKWHWFARSLASPPSAHFFACSLLGCVSRLLALTFSCYGNRHFPQQTVESQEKEVTMSVFLCHHPSPFSSMYSSNGYFLLRWQVLQFWCVLLHWFSFYPLGPEGGDNFLIF